MKIYYSTEFHRLITENENHENCTEITDFLSDYVWNNDDNDGWSIIKNNEIHKVYISMNDEIPDEMCMYTIIDGKPYFVQEV